MRLVVVDEWHELLGNKRGTQTQLALARLAHWRPDLQVWGLSATLGNLDLARDALLAPVENAARRGARRAAENADRRYADSRHHRTFSMGRPSRHAPG